MDQINFSWPSPDDEHRLGLWVPEVEFIFTPSSGRRFFVYIHNWLRYRVHIFHLLSGISCFSPPRPGAWRTLLARFPSMPLADKPPPPTQVKKRFLEKQHALEFFSTLLKQELTLDSEMPESVMWRGTTIPSQPIVDNIDAAQQYARQFREMAWELSEVGFRVELYALDRHLVPASPAHRDNEETVRRTLIATLVGEDTGDSQAWRGGNILPNIAGARNGLRAPHPRDRAQSLEAFRRLILRWPNCPRYLSAYDALDSSTPDGTLEKFEYEAAHHYCQRFYEWAGRAPAVPRAVVD